MRLTRCQPLGVVIWFKKLSLGSLENVCLVGREIADRDRGTSAWLAFCPAKIIRSPDPLDILGEAVAIQAPRTWPECQARTQLDLQAGRWQMLYEQHRTRRHREKNDCAIFYLALLLPSSHTYGQFRASRQFHFLPHPSTRPLTRRPILRTSQLPTPRSDC